MISLKSTGFHYGFHFGFHSSGRSTDFIPEIWQISWNPLDFMPEPFKSDNSRKTLHFHRVQGAYVIWNLWYQSIPHEIHQFNWILLKATEFHRISWNKQDLTHFYKMQHNFTKTNRIYGNPEISKDFMKSYRILLKATEFYRISLNSLQISLQILLQISLWMSFMGFTADFITDFTVVFILDFTANFMLNLPDFIIYVMAISLHLPGFHQKSTRFHEVHSFLQDFT